MAYMGRCRFGHVWVYEGKWWSTDPPRQRRICALCGRVETVDHGTPDREPSFEDIRREFDHGMEEGK